MLKYEFTTPKPLAEYPKELINALLHPTEEDDYYSLCDRYNYEDVLDAMTAIMSEGDEKRWFEEEIGQYAWDYYRKELIDEFAERNAIIGNRVEW